jgi:hypothetical protein
MNGIVRTTTVLLLKAGESAYNEHPMRPQSLLLGWFDAVHASNIMDTATIASQQTQIINFVVFSSASLSGTGSAEGKPLASRLTAVAFTKPIAR